MVALGLALAAAAAPTAAPAAAGGNVFRILSGGDIRSLDPPGADGSEDWWSAGLVLYNYLYSYDKEGKLFPDIAADLPKISGEGKIYTIIREAIRNNWRVTIDYRLLSVLAITRRDRCEDKKHCLDRLPNHWHMLEHEDYEKMCPLVVMPPEVMPHACCRRSPDRTKRGAIDRIVYGLGCAWA